jgi:hypothetical protein
MKTRAAERAGGRGLRAKALVLGLAALGPVFGSAPAATCPPHLFVIERSKNANLVVYDANLTASGALDAKSPVTVYWILNAKEGQREELNRVERNRAYGFDIAPGKESGTYSLTLEAGKNHPFVVAIRQGCPVVLDTIDGRESILDKIFVKEKSGGGLNPAVETVQFFGRDAADGSLRTETIVPKP